MSESSAIIFLVYWFFYCSLVGGVWGLEEGGVWGSGGRGRNGCVGSRSPGEVLLKASDHCPYRTSYLKCIHIIQYKYMLF